MTSGTGVRLALVTLMVVALSACGGEEEGTGTGDTSTTADVSATVKDFSISLDPASVASGDTSFSITNDGPSTHEFVVFQTDLAPDALPVEGGVVPEDAPDLALAGEAEDIASGSTASLSLPLEAGSYVVICNIPSHYEAGMHASLTVT